MGSEGAESVLERVDEVLFEEMTFEVQPGQGKAYLRKEHSRQR